jgi:hypothetical protein
LERKFGGLIMDKINGLIGLLGEDNQNKIKGKVTDFIIEAIEDDIKEYDRENYILNPEEIIDFIQDCKEEAFKKVKDEVVNNMADKIRLSLNGGV